MDQPESEGVRLLSFDGGDIRAVSQLLILDEFMRRVEWDRKSTNRILPCDYFHMMAGVGTGGIIVILLVTLRMGIEEAIEEFINIWTSVFADASLDQVTRSAKLEVAIRDLLHRKGLSGDRRMFNGGGEDSSRRAFVCAVPESNFGMCEKFRSYKSRETSSNPTIVEAIRATCAIPALFTPVSIESVGCQVSYVTGAYNFNNPAWETVKEACETFGQSRLVACMLSLGCGQRPTSRLSQKNEASIASLVNDIASDSELVDRDLAWRIGKSNVYYRLSVDQILESDGDSSLGLTGELTSFTKVFLEHPTTAEKVDQCTKASERLGRVTLTDISGLSEPKPATAHGLPLLSAFFVERPGLIKQMAQCLFRVGPPAQRRIVLSGLGGIGKTQITISFLHQFLSRFRHVLFIDGSSVQSIESGVIAKVKSLGLTYSRTSASEALEVLAHPDHEITRDWAIVYDNVDNRDINIADYFPLCSFGTIFITTRNRNLGNLVPNAHLELDVMAKEEAADVLLRSAFAPSHLITETDKQHALEIAKELGYLPVALVQAGYFIKIHNCIHDYQKRLRERRPDILSRPAQDQLDPHYHGVYATLNVTWPHLSSRAQNLMSILGFVSYTGFPLGLLYLAADRSFLFEPLTLVDRSRRKRWYSRHHSAGGDFGARSSPVRSEDAAKPPRGSGKRKIPLLLHPAEMWRKYARSRSGSTSFHQTVQLLCATLRPEEPEDPQDIDDLVAELERYSLVTRTTTFMVTTLRLHPLVHSWTHDRLSLEEKEVYRAAAVRLLVCGTDNDDQDLYEFMYPHVILMSDRLAGLHVNDQAGLAAVLAHQGDIKTATELWEGIQRNVLVLYGRNDIRCGEADLQLALIYRSTEDEEKGEVASQLEKEVVDVRKRTFGSEHPMTMKAVVQLANGMKDHGKQDDAASILRDAIAFWERQPGDHWETILRIKEELTSCCDEREAINLYTEVLQARMQRSGPDHHATLKAMEALADAYADPGWRGNENYGATRNSATDIWISVVATRTNKRGIEHPDTLNAMESLAWSYYIYGSPIESAALWEKVIRVRKAIQGAHHEDTLYAMMQREFLYEFDSFSPTKKQKELREEIVCAREEIVRLSKEAKGPGHKDTLEAMKTLASTWEEWKNYNKAEEQRKTIVCLTREVHAPSHADTIEAMNALAKLYETWEKYAESEDQWKGIVLLEKKAHGPSHEGTLRAMTGLANLYRVWMKYTESEAQWREIFHFTKEAHGLNHEDTLVAMRGLAKVYVDWGEYTEAEEQWREILRLTRETRGSNHKDILDAMRELAEVYEKWKKYIKAEEQRKEILRLTRETRGSNHKDTLEAMRALANVYEKCERFTEAISQLEWFVRFEGDVEDGSYHIIFQSMESLAKLYERVGRYNEAMVQGEEIVKLERGRHGPSAWPTLYSMEALAETYERFEHYTKAMAQWEEIVQLTTDANGASHEDTAKAMARLAEMYESCEQYIEATGQWEEIVQLTKDANGASHEDTLKAMARLAERYERSEQHAKATAQWEEIVQLTKDANGASHENTLKAMARLAERYERSEQHTKATAQWKEILELAKKSHGLIHPETLYPLAKVVRACDNTEAYAEWEAQFKEDIGLTRDTQGPSHQDTVAAMAGLAKLYQALRKYAEAKDQWEEIIRLTKETCGPSSLDTLKAIKGLARMYEASERHTEAIVQLEEIVRVARDERTLGTREMLDAMKDLTRLYQRSEQYTKAMAQQEEIVQLMKVDDGFDFVDWSFPVQSLVEMYMKFERYEDAETLVLGAIDRGRRGDENKWTTHKLGKLLKEVRSRPARTNDTPSMK